MSRYLFLLTVMLFTGCTIVPESIDVPEGTQLVSYSKAVTSGANAQGQKARWGGMIVGVENKPNKTLIELAHFPLNHYGKPSTNGETSGRFKVQIDGFVDPIVFEEGRSATFLGTITAPTAGMVGEQPYIYPTIIAEDYHMWRKQEVYDVNTYFFNYHTGWYSPFYRFNGPWMYPHFNRTRVIRYQNAPSKAKIPSSNNKPTNNNSKRGQSPSTNKRQ
ncbi:Slp family lipoprotein [Alteromonas sp. BL110]|uniref:Slp family lipoprotein n=1 Tax=Alteromonas sp. BL110 TaxID=1714845 RepID=UPI000E4D7E1C|nr:Slp family lipoprotein [Alteromonas sp. BL110]AXT39850.1 Slp family lipoprotein [Alteromonas sp. BL110]RKM79079.1 Slp family lipoprotein [Alteromonas sp. BL110]